MGRRNQAGDSLPRGGRKWSVALYIRLSKEDGNDVSNSVVHQQERLNARLSTFGDDYVLVDTYKDDGYTGTDTNRKDFQRMLKDIREHKVNCVIVKDLSRLSRNLTDATYYIENVFIEYDVRFISLELPALDSYMHPEQMNSILIPIQNVINDDFCRQTSIKVRGVLNQKRMMGQFIGAFAPYGYAKNPKDKHSLIIDEEAARVVRDIFKWYVKQGVSKGGIARKLNEQGIPNPAAYKRLKGLKYANPNTKSNDALWGQKTVREILRNQMYLGHMVQGRYRVKSYKVHTQIATPKEEWYIVKDTHEPIIGHEVFELAQRLQEKDTRQTQGSKTVYVLSGFVRCSDCKKAMVRSQGGSRKKTTYYQCRTYREKSKDACSIHSIRAEALEDAVFHALRSQMALISSFKNILDEIISFHDERDESRRLCVLISNREKELNRIIEDKDSLYADWKNGDLTRDDFRRLKAKYDERAAILKKTITSQKKAEQDMEAEIERENQQLKGFFEHRGMRELYRSAVVDLIDTVYVHEGGKVEIVFNFRDQQRLIMGQ